jgi:hypothetical protein
MSIRTQAFRQRLRFSLGTMLVVVTLLCLVFGLWTSRAVRQREAVTALQAIGDDVQVRYAYEVNADYEWKYAEPPGPEWLRGLLGIDYLSSATSVRIYHAKNDQLALLKGLAGLRALDLSACHEVTDAGIAHLRELTSLRKLTIYGSQMTGAGLSALAPLTNLQEIYLLGCDNVTDDGMAHLARITSLRKLGIDQSELLTNTGMAELRSLPNLETLTLAFTAATTDTVLEPLESLPSLRHLELTYWQRPGNGGLQYLAGFERLESLVLNGNEGLTDADMSQLPPLAQLKSLFIHGSRFTEAALENLDKFPNLQELHLAGGGESTARSMAHLQQLPKLTRLSILGDLFGLTDEGLAVIGKLSSLRSLQLTACKKLTDGGIASLAELSDLEELDISVDHLNQFSAAALVSLRAALPKCRIDYRQMQRGF